VSQVSQLVNDNADGIADNKNAIDENSANIASLIPSTGIPRYW
jgi:hypothetical protein